MAGSGLWAKVHKWLALLMAAQILFWFASGLFFAVFPIDRVRSEHRIAVQPAAPLDLAAAAAGLVRLAGEGPEKVEIKSLLGRPVALLAGREGRPRLYDLASGRRLSPISGALAARIAEADHDGSARAVKVQPIAANDTEYRGPLPAWRVEFAEEGRALYVAADSGSVTARRSTLWRVYDFLWGLHIMDWRHHEDFNSPLLIVATALALVMSIAGIVLLPSRLGFTAWRRRRRANRSASG
jgi:hypothetical protein